MSAQITIGRCGHVVVGMAVPCEPLHGAVVKAKIGARQGLMAMQ